MSKQAVLIPSSIKISGDEKRRFAGWCASCGLEFLPTRDVEFADYYGDCGRPEERANLIIEVLQNENVEAVFMQGGSGADEVVECLKKRQSEIISRKIPLIGFSDATQIQQYLAAIGAITAVQGAYGVLDTEENIDLARKSLMASSLSELEIAGRMKSLAASAFASEKMKEFLLGRESINPLLVVNDLAFAASEIIGKTVVYNDHTARTSYGIITDPKYRPILLIEAGFRGESVAEGLLRARAWMEKNGGEENFQAMVISGSDGKCFGGKLLEACDLSEIRSGIVDMKIPVFFGAPFGHGGVTPCPLALNTDSRIIADGEGKALFCVAATRSAEDVAELRRIYEEKEKGRSIGVAIDDAALEKIFQNIVAVNVDPSRDFGEGERVFLGCAQEKYRRGCDVPALIDKDLKGKNIFIALGIPSEEQFRKYDKVSDYEAAKFHIARQAAQMSLMEMVKTGNAQDAATLMIVASEELPERFSVWLSDFSKRHELAGSLLVAYAPDFPSERLSSVEARFFNLNIKMKEVARSSAVATGGGRS